MFEKLSFSLFGLADLTSQLLRLFHSFGKELKIVILAPTQVLNKIGWVIQSFQTREKPVDFCFVSFISGFTRSLRIIFSLMCIFIFLNFAGAGDTAKAETNSSAGVILPVGKKRISVGPILATKAVYEKTFLALKTTELRQVLETLDSTLIDQFNSSRKFEVVARKAALTSIFNEQQLGASGVMDPPSAAKAFKIAGSQYLVVTTITDFVMGNEVIKFDGLGIAANREAVRISCSIQIYDTTTGKLIESARFRGQDIIASPEGRLTADGASLTKITDRLAAELVGRVVDVIYPARVAAKNGNQITVNRGESAGVAVGQEWTVFALGEEIKDPDTGDLLGRNEVETGTIKIIRVSPKLSYGEATEDAGIAIGHILRARQIQTSSEEPKQGQSPFTEEKPKSTNEKVKRNF